MEDHLKEPRRAHKSNEFNALFVAYESVSIFARITASVGTWHTLWLLARDWAASFFPCFSQAKLPHSNTPGNSRSNDSQNIPLPPFPQQRLCSRLMCTICALGFLRTGIQSSQSIVQWLHEQHKWEPQQPALSSPYLWSLSETHNSLNMHILELQAYW